MCAPIGPTSMTIDCRRRAASFAAAAVSLCRSTRTWDNDRLESDVSLGPRNRPTRREPLGHPIQDSGDHHSAVAVADKHDTLAVFVPHQIHDVLDVGIEVHARAGKMNALTESGQRRGEYVAALRAKKGTHTLPCPPARPTPWTSTKVSTGTFSPEAVMPAGMSGPVQARSGPTCLRTCRSALRAPSPSPPGAETGGGLRRGHERAGEVAPLEAQHPAWT